MDTWQLLKAENPVFRSYAYWSGALVLKTMAMSIVTGIVRFRHKSYINPEDTVLHRVPVDCNNDQVERTRRAHRNDLENIVPLLLIGLMYVLTKPDYSLATRLFSTAAVSRIVHTFSYAFGPVPQPLRALSFFVAYFICAYMSYEVMVHFQ